jgi:hypothetical protein
MTVCDGVVRDREKLALDGCWGQSKRELLLNGELPCPQRLLRGRVVSSRVYNQIILETFTEEPGRSQKKTANDLIQDDVLRKPLLPLWPCPAFLCCSFTHGDQSVIDIIPILVRIVKLHQHSSSGSGSGSGRNHRSNCILAISQVLGTSCVRIERCWFNTHTSDLIRELFIEIHKSAALYHCFSI